MKNGQAGIEFIILIGFLIFAFAVFFLVINNNLSDKIERRVVLELIEIARTVRDEIALAKDSSDGYYREFFLPKTIYSGEYRIWINETIVFAETLDKEHIVSFPVQNVTGQPIIGKNTIKRVGGEVILNG
ncbi:hypothetical protein D6829_00935 [Candidatus Pacearchaeota archaeon]|nr:MAG: hypothetical protein D6829_00935 [Candidatus Pacearchaeota archaeon]